MTNRQWLMNEMQNMSDEEFGRFFNGTTVICDLQEPNCPCESNDTTCTECKAKWLKSEHKEPIKLSDAERVILENVDKEYKWIARDDDTGHLHIYIEKPIRIGKEKYWSVDMDDDYKTISFYDNLFKFIKGDDNKPYNIEELLKGK